MSEKENRLRKIWICIFPIRREMDCLTKWKERIPDNYYCQVLHYLAVTEYEFAVLKAQLKSGCGFDARIEVRHYLIERKDVEEDIRMLTEAEKCFWDCVEAGRRPDLILPAI